MKKGKKKFQPQPFSITPQSVSPANRNARWVGKSGVATKPEYGKRKKKFQSKLFSITPQSGIPARRNARWVGKSGIATKPEKEKRKKKFQPQPFSITPLTVSPTDRNETLIENLKQPLRLYSVTPEILCVSSH